MKNRLNILRTLLLISSLAVELACGVKADPQPPLTPIEIGRGKPLYREEEDATPLQRRVLPEDEQKNDQDSDENQ